MSRFIGAAYATLAYAAELKLLAKAAMNRRTPQGLGVFASTSQLQEALFGVVEIEVVPRTRVLSVEL